MSAPRRPSVLVDWPHESPDSWYHLNCLNFFIADCWLKLTRAGGRQAEFIAPSPATPGFRRHLTPQIHAASSGASMPLTRHPML